eukprot:m51a1_g9209 putative nuclear pore membrane glycoprotein (1978) ;mRNA; f:11387-19365
MLSPRSALLLALALAALAHARSGPASPPPPPPAAAPGEPSISDVTVLLPFARDAEHAVHTITAKNGCFSWASSKPHVVRLEPGPAERRSASGALCSSYARVIPVAQSTATAGAPQPRLSVVVLATDQDSGQQLRCDVFLDNIAKIDIGSRTRQVYKDDEEALQVQAYDATGNVFTTLVGVAAKWEVAQDEPRCLRIGRFADSHLEVPPLALEMERQGRQTSIVILRGEQFGQGQVSVRLVDYPRVPQVSVTMTVRMHMVVLPSRQIHMALGTHTQFNVHTPKPRDNGHTDPPVRMPDSRYVWSSSNPKVATVDNTGRVTAVGAGTADIRVHFSNFKDDAQEGSVRVSEPHTLSMAVTPVEESVPLSFGRPLQSGFYLIDKHLYNVNLSVTDVHGNAFEDLSEMKFDITAADSKKLKISGNYYQPPTAQASTLETGRTTIIAALVSVAGKSSSIKTTREVVITSPVVIDPAEVLLPFVADDLVPHTWQFTASGGSGEYRWESEEPIHVAPVNALGVVTAVGTGRTVISVYDAQNAYNRVSAVVEVAQPHSIEFVPSLTEAAVGSGLELTAVARDRERRLFSNCSALGLVWDVVPAAPSSGVASFDLAPADAPAPAAAAAPRKAGASPAGCGTRTVVARRDGQAVVSARLEHAAAVGAETRVFAHRPLEVVRPQPLPAVAALGTSVRFTTDGGLAPWCLDPSTHVRSAEAQSPQSVTFAPDAMAHTTVTCTQIGDQTLTLRATNPVSASHPVAASSAVQVPWVCAEPYRLLLVPEAATTAEAAAAAASSVCSGVGAVLIDDASQARAGGSLVVKLTMRNSRVITLLALVLDAKGRSFFNDTSLIVSWRSTDSNLMTWDGESNWSRQMQLSDKTGVVHLTVTVTGYNKTVLDAAGVKNVPVLRSPELTREIEIHLVPNVAVSPASATLLNHPENVLELAATHGSGKYRFAIEADPGSGPSVATIEHVPGSRVARLRPLRAGSVKVVVTDQCLAGSSPVYTTVTISDLRELKIVVPDLVRVGDTVEAQVTALDAAGNAFGIDQLRHVSVRLAVDCRALSLVDDAQQQQQQRRQQQKQQQGAQEYTLAGNAPGSCPVSASVSLPGGRVVVSNTVQVQVFPPFALAVHEASLLPGSSMQLLTTGGPSMREEVTFEVVGGDAIAAMSADGVGIVVGRSIGVATVRATVTATHSVTKKRVVYGEDTAVVTVRYLSGIRIRSSSSRIVAGTEQKVWVEGLTDETPFSLATIGLKYQWSVTDSHFVELKGFFEDVGHSLAQENGYSARVLAKSRGTALVTVSVVGDTRGLTAQAHLSATLQVSVIDPLVLTSPSSLRLPPNSAFKITTSKDSHGSMRYEVLPAPGQQQQRAPVTVDRNGIVKTSSVIGSAVVLVHDGEHEPVAVAVTVKPVAQLEVLPAASVRVRDVPIGEVAEFVVVMRDDAGQQFHAKPQQSLTATINLPAVGKIIDAGVDTGVVVRAEKPGRAIVHVYINENPSIEDYVPVHVAHVVVPSSPVVHVGGTVQFSTSSRAAAASSSSSGRALWESSAPGVMRIDGASGRADAVAEGVATITYQGAISTFTTVRVARLAGVELADGRRAVVASGGAPVRLPLRFRTTAHELLTGELTQAFSASAQPAVPQIAHNLRVKCAVDETAWVRADAGRDAATGEYFCELTPVKRPTYEPAPASLHVTISASDQRRQNSADASVAVDFLPAFYAAERSVRLGGDRKRATITVHNARATLSVAPSDPNHVSVVGVASEAEGTAKFVVSPAHDPSLPWSSTIVISDSATGQREALPVSYSASAPPAEPNEERRDARKPDAPEDAPDEDEERGIGFPVFAVFVVLIAATSTFAYERENVTNAVLYLSRSIRRAARPAPPTGFNGAAMPPLGQQRSPGAPLQASPPGYSPRAPGVDPPCKLWNTVFDCIEEMGCPRNSTGAQLKCNLKFDQSTDQSCDKYRLCNSAGAVLPAVLATLAVWAVALVAP